MKVQQIWMCSRRLLKIDVFPHSVEGEEVCRIYQPLSRGMSVKDYSLKFTQLSKYAPTCVANSRSRIKMFLMGVSKIG